MKEGIIPCPFNEDCSVRVAIFDDEGNRKGWPGDEYEDDPWSGLQYGIIHDGECGLGYVTFGFQPTFDAIVKEWNTRCEKRCHPVERFDGDSSNPWGEFVCSVCGRPLRYDKVGEDYEYAPYCGCGAKVETDEGSEARNWNVS